MPTRKEPELTPAAQSPSVIWLLKHGHVTLRCPCLIHEYRKPSALNIDKSVRAACPNTFCDDTSSQTPRTSCVRFSHQASSHHLKLS